MSLCWIEFVVFTIVFDANIAIRVNEEFLWGRHQDHRSPVKSCRAFLFLGLVEDSALRRTSRLHAGISGEHEPRVYLCAFGEFKALRRSLIPTPCLMPVPFNQLF